jgi:DUF1680 family protein
MIEKAQQEDGYLIIYFTVVDKEGRFKNLRDMHEMCEFLLSFLSVVLYPSVCPTHGFYTRESLNA